MQTFLVHLAAIGHSGAETMDHEKPCQKNLRSNGGLESKGRRDQEWEEAKHAEPFGGTGLCPPNRWVCDPLQKSTDMNWKEHAMTDCYVSERDDLDNLLTERRVGAYVGVDPTAPSLHVGHLLPFMALGWLYIHGYGSVFLVSSPRLLLPRSNSLKSVS